MSDRFEQIFQSVADAIRDGLRTAYEAGRESGRQEAAEDLRAKLERVVLSVVPGEHPSGTSSARPDFIVQTDKGPVTVEVKARAVPGSVKPRVLNAVRQTPGATTADIQRRTGAKPNSVRGTLWTLSNEKLVERRGDGWFPLGQTNEPSDSQSRADTSEGSGSQPRAQGREAEVPGGGT